MRIAACIGLAGLLVACGDEGLPKRVDELERRMSAVEAQTGATDERLTGVQQSLEGRISALEARLASIDESLGRVGEGLKSNVVFKGTLPYSELSKHNEWCKDRTSLLYYACVSAVARWCNATQPKSPDRPGPFVGLVEYWTDQHVEAICLK